MGYNSPKEIVRTVITVAEEKGSHRVSQLFILAMMGGAYIGLGSMVAILVAANIGGVASANPGLVKFIFGALFPLGFILVTLAGAELFTSTTAVTAVGVLSQRYSLKKLLQIWAVSYGGNLIGALLTVYLLGNFSHIFSTEIYQHFIFSIAEHKLENSFDVTLVKGVGANWLVCLAAWLTYASKDVTGKIVALWFPVMAFVTLGFEHSIANMFFIPLAKSFGYSVSWGELFMKNLLPATIGNIIGGSLLVGVGYWFIYGDSKQSPTIMEN